VPSRRLGRSLGVDLVPLKACTLDCVYCQIGRTTERTLARRDYVSNDVILKELAAKLAAGVAADYITLSGSGEPTLHADIGDLIDSIRSMTAIPIAILTNGTLLGDPEVRHACAKADVVVPSLDAGDETVFQQINRPHATLSLSKLVDGICAFRDEFDGEIWLEVFLIEGLNTSDEQVRRIGALAERIRPEKIHLNTAVRPTAETDVRPLAPERLDELRRELGPKAEVVADFRRVHERAEFRAKQEDVLAMLRRRPCSADDVANGLGIHRHEAAKFLGELGRAGEITEETRDGVVYYACPSDA